MRLFSTEDGSLVKKMVRGMSSCVIKDLSFSANSDLLSLTSSDKPTVHVWRCAGLGRQYLRAVSSSDGGAQPLLDRQASLASGLDDDGAAAGNTSEVNKENQLTASGRTFNKLLGKVKSKIKGNSKDVEHMMWTVAAVDPKLPSKFCGFSLDETTLLVATEDARFFKTTFDELGEITGFDLFTGK